MRRVERIVWGIVGVLAWCALAGESRGEPQAVALPVEYVDFTLDPDTGDVFAIAAETDELVRLGRAALDEGRVERVATVRVGPSPSSLCYKQFGDSRVVAVVCAKDSRMYIINAKDTSLLAEIELASAGVVLVTGSQNPKDPFLYYCYGGGHDSLTGVVSLRDTKAHGVAFDHSSDCALSASGEIAYRRGPWSPSGFESLIRITGLTENKSVFQRLFYNHESTAPYVPDPFDRYTAAGNRIYSRSLEKFEAALDFVPLCFSRTRPVVFGTPQEDSTSRRDPSTPRTLTVRAASTNTFSNIGKGVTLDRSSPAELGAKPKTPMPRPDQRQIPTRAKLFADDERATVIFAEGSHLFLIPWSDFGIPEEPFLMATLETDGPVLVGKENRITVKPFDPRVTVTLDNGPWGSKSDGGTLLWNPAMDRVGPATLMATLKHGELQRTLRIDLEAEYPNVTLPFAASQFAISDDGQRAVVWQGPAPTPRRRSQSDPVPSGPFRMALVDLKTGKSVAEKTLANPVAGATLSDRHVVLTMAESPACEIMRIPDLQREKSLVATSPIIRVGVGGNLLLLRTQAGLEVYDMKSFERRRTFTVPVVPANQHLPPRPEASMFSVTPDGFWFDGVLYGFDLQARLVIDPGQLPTIQGADRNLQRPGSSTTPSPEGSMPFADAVQRGGRVAVVTVPGTNVTVGLDARSFAENVPNSVHTWRSSLELVLSAWGGGYAKQMIVKQRLYSATADTTFPPSPSLQAMPRGVAVVFGTKLYRWDVPPLAAPDDSKPGPLTWTLRQSAVSLDGSGKTMLTHDVGGGASPVTFTALPIANGISVESANGKVTLDEKLLLDAAASAAKTFVRGRSQGRPLVDTFHDVKAAMDVRANEILGRTPRGVPVAIPICLDAINANGEGSRFQYFVLAEVPTEPLLKAWSKEDTLTRAPIVRPPPPPPRPAPGDPVGRIEKLEQRLEALEQRLDLMTRQFNGLLEKQDGIKP